MAHLLGGFHFDDAVVVLHLFHQAAQSDHNASLGGELLDFLQCLSMDGFGVCQDKHTIVLVRDGQMLVLDLGFLE